MKKNITDFFFEYYEKNTIPDVFSNVYYTQEKKDLINSNYQKKKNSSRINSVMFIPNYIAPQIDRDLFNLKKVTQFFKGYAILLDKFDSIDAYLKYRFKKNAKSILKRLKRLEISFPISYEFHYGAISEKDYNFYMDTLKEMITKRFQQRNDVSQNLLNWNHYHKIFFNLINNSKASLFVIKNNSEPICISLSNHFNGKMFSSVSSYNIDYAKFSLGSIEIYKKLEWCLENNHNTYEFGMGDLSYKREWSNDIYHFNHQIIYPKKSIIAIINANIEFLKVSIKEGIYKLTYVRYKKWKAKRNKTMPFKLNYKLSSVDNDINALKSYKKIDYNTDQYLFLRKIVFDFLYSNIEHINDVVVYEKSKTSYLIIGSKKNQKVVFD
ncbi:GNAT family N-acetyltransferase [Flavivirga jejuensis]|uniref:GNAT family N-acetyltransferase n=1 Tax=Flavivirga jejuensis TaxID=870487 RepID=A0ABT8WRM3_9FLAO|nr:GNAT family N-acetyltransferase [Flavivirga jejuensis]MDO5975814.1 GNAT family N-acetyltransferase [Flavivirga jejuensis]